MELKLVVMRDLKVILTSRKCKLLLLFCLCTVSVSASNVISFRISRPYCVFNFIYTAAGGAGTSVALKKYIDSVALGDTRFTRLVEDFSSIRLVYNYRRDEIPENRHPVRSTFDLLANAAVKSSDFEDFADRISGILPNSSILKLYRVMIAVSEYYDQLIWKPYHNQIENQLTILKSYSKQTDELFKKLKLFYQAQWDFDMPFVVSIYPIPGKNGSTSATPHGNSLCIGVLTQEANMIRRLGIVIHEMCHVLYDEQTANFQKKLDYFLKADSSVYTQYASNYLDEAMATACGNGWATQQLTHLIDTGSWYADPYINDFAHAIYQLTSDYIVHGKSMDSLYLIEALKLFAAKFPKVIYDYRSSMNKIVIYSDVETVMERQQVNDILYRNFKISSSNFSSPILHEFSINTMKTSPVTQVIIIDRKHEITLSELKEVFPKLTSLMPNMSLQKNFILSFNERRRNIIIVQLEQLLMLEKAMQTLRRQVYINPDNAVTFF